MESKRIVRIERVAIVPSDHPSRQSMPFQEGDPLASATDIPDVFVKRHSFSERSVVKYQVQILRFIISGDVGAVSPKYFRIHFNHGIARSLFCHGIWGRVAPPTSTGK